MEMKKKKEQNQSIYVTLIVILVALAVAVGITSVVGKRTSDPAVDDVLQSDGDTLADDALADDSSFTDEKPVFDEKLDSQPLDSEDESAAVTEKPDMDTESLDSETPDTNAGAAPEAALPEFVCPVSGYLLNGFSESVPVFSVTMNDYRTHSGVDVFAEQGMAVCAAADGVIGAIWEDPMMGTCMTVVHSGGAVSTYKGLYSTIPDGIVQGVSVSKGQPIAAVGDTALAEIEEQSHVHYELAIDGVNVDPCLYIQFSEDVYEN